MKHTPEPWIADGGYRVQGNCSGHRYDILHLDQTPMHIPGVNPKANADRIVACVNACAGLDIEKVAALLDAVRAECESKYDDKISTAEHTRRQHVRMRACDELRDSIRAAKEVANG